MNPGRKLLLAAMISVAPTVMVFAQQVPPTGPTSPSSASSPHQREATSTNTPEASSTDNTQGTSPSAASTPHQQQATSGQQTHTASKQSMKACTAKQQTENPGMANADAKKACKAQMKGPG